jgi:hypothetical protein
MAVATVFVKPKPRAARNRKRRDRLARITVCGLEYCYGTRTYFMLIKTFAL